MSTSEELNQIIELKAQLAILQGVGQKGTITIWLEKIFGRNWQTSLAGVMTVLPQIVNYIQDHALDLHVPAIAMNFASLFSFVIFALYAKSQTVTGVNRIATTGLPGPTEAVLVQEAAAAVPTDPTVQVAAVLPAAIIKVIGGK